MEVSFWQGKKVIITGHTGFKGGWLSLWLQKLGAEVIGISLDPPSNPNFYETAKVAESMISLREDIRNLDNIKKLFIKYQPEIVFHLAAQPLVRYSYNNPVETYATNVMGTLHILEAIRSVKSVRAAVMITSDKCYDNKEWEWGYRENEPMGGHDPYSSSKGCAELLISSFRDSYFPIQEYEKHKTAIASVRTGNVIGGGDWAEDRLIPDIIRAIKKNKAINIRNPDAIRPWQHVLEPLSGYLQLAERLYLRGMLYAEAWNFGPNDKDARNVLWIVKKMIKTWSKDIHWEIDDSKQPHEANHLKLDCSKAHTRLNWYPKWDLKITLEQIIKWHKAEIEGDNMKEITLSQIEIHQTFL